jgi:hypothetical protein
MNKHEREELDRRVAAALVKAMKSPEWFEWRIVREIVEREVTRAIRAERRAQRIASDARAAWREEAQEQAVTAAVERHGRKL